MGSGDESKEGDCVTRHCAYCLKLCGLPIKLCGGCKKRAYCSKECQRADWSIKGNGQRHINWCRRHEYGEEDVDWEVVPIPNKGLGIRAKKLLPAGFKIIVEPVFTSPLSHPGIEDLGPEGKSLQEKFIKNILVAGNAQEEVMTVALRIARVNHACQPNAATIFDETARVAILFAQKDIQPGGEIFICYYSPFFSLVNSKSLPGMNPEFNIEEDFNLVKNQVLLSAYGFTCSDATCSCHNPTFQALVKEGRQIYGTFIDLANQLKVEEALVAGEKLLDIHQQLNVSWIYLGITYFNLFRVAVRKSETLPRSKEYIRSAAELFGKICPYSESQTKMFEKLLKHPETEPDYMLIDKLQEQEVSNLMEHFLNL